MSRQPAAAAAHPGGRCASEDDPQGIGCPAIAIIATDTGDRVDQPAWPSIGSDPCA
jgi:hypothetical protein